MDRGIAIRNATILGRLDLEYINIPFPLWFESCPFEEVLFVNPEDLDVLSLTDSPEEAAEIIVEADRERNGVEGPGGVRRSKKRVEPGRR